MNKFIKQIIEKLNSNKWIYWFLSLTIILSLSVYIQKKTVNEILFEQYSQIADRISLWIFIALIAFIIVKRFKK